MHKINLSSPEPRPIYTVPYRAGPKVREAKEQESEKMLAMKVVSHTQTEWASPFVLVPMKNRTLRFAKTIANTVQ